MLSLEALENSSKADLKLFFPNIENKIATGTFALGKNIVIHHPPWQDFYSHLIPGIYYPGYGLWLTCMPLLNMQKF